MDINLTNIKTGISVIKKAADSLPANPGVYKMLDEQGKHLYIGKAKSLAKRVPSYANIEKLPTRLKRMVSLLRRIEYITTKTEAEALLLEANFIQSIKPPYNINLKDDKSFPYIIFEDNHAYPRVAKYRGKKKPGVTYFGPFASASHVNQTIVELQKLFFIRPCTDSFFAARERPCLQYQIKRCSAPCVKKITTEEYREAINQAKDFLEGKNSRVYEKLQKEMDAASTKMEYEKAAKIRDRIRVFSQIQARNMFNQHSIDNADIIAMCRDKQGNACIQVFIVRGGKNFGNRPFFYSDIDDQSEQELMESFLIQFYQKQISPKKVICNIQIENAKVIEQALAELVGYKVKIEYVRKGSTHDFVEFAESNARDALEKHRHDNLKNIASLRAVMNLFELKKIPKRIEVYDNSHIQGEDAVGCMVVAGIEGFIKTEYRIFNIKKVEIGDDYAMLREVLTRRFSKLSEDNYPDLLLVDGGMGHLSTASGVLQALGIGDVTLVTISKGRDRNAGREFFHMKGRESFQLPKGDATLHYLQVLRDEAHRYAIETHRKKRAKKISLSGLDEIPNIGKIRKRILLTHFGSVEKIKEASISDLNKIAGISKKTAKLIKEYF